MGMIAILSHLPMLPSAVLGNGRSQGRLLFYRRQLLPHMVEGKPNEEDSPVSRSQHLLREQGQSDPSIYHKDDHQERALRDGAT